MARHEELMAAAGSTGAFYAFNAQDPCCYRMQSGDPFIEYLNEAARTSGKRLRVFVDLDHREHSLSALGYAELGRFLDAALSKSTGAVAAVRPRPISGGH